MELYPDKQLEHIVAGCRKRDIRCQRELFERYYRRMLSLCIRYSPNREEAEDLAQEGFIKLFDKIDSYDSRGTFDGWIRRLFVNLCLDKLRLKKEYNMSYDSMFDETHGFVEEMEPESFQPCAEHMLAEVAKLPPAFRTVFNLYVLDGYKHLEISAELGISEGTSKSYLSRARELLRKSLTELIAHKNAS